MNQDATKCLTYSVLEEDKRSARISNFRTSRIAYIYAVESSGTCI